MQEVVDGGAFLPSTSGPSPWSQPPLISDKSGGGDEGKGSLNSWASCSNELILINMLGTSWYYRPMDLLKLVIRPKPKKQYIRSTVVKMIHLLFLIYYSQYSITNLKYEKVYYLVIGTERSLHWAYIYLIQRY